MRSFLGFGQVPFIGTPGTRPIKLAGLSGVVVPLFFQWISYGASTLNSNINVLVNMESAACRALDQIRSVYIDNLGSDNPIYVFFPDTNSTIVAKPNSEGWFPVYSNSKTIWVVGEGFLTGDIPQTFLLVSNVPMFASVNNEIDNAVALWKASPVITRGTSIYNAALGIPALGDQFFASGLLSLSSAGPDTVSLWGTPYSSGFLYLTALNVNLITASINVSTAIGEFDIESTGVAGTLVKLNYGVTIQIQDRTLLNQNGMQTKLDATQTWCARKVTAINTGFAQIISSFTVAPT